MRKLSLILGAVALAAIFALGLATPRAGLPEALAADAQPTIYSDDMFMGKADAKVTVIEYASLSCPHCAAFNADTLPQIKANYIDKGTVRWIYRDFPLNRPAYQAAILAHCTSPLRYFSLVDALFKSQSFWEAQPEPLVALKQIGVSQGVDESAYNACLNDAALREKILARLKEASDTFKVEATPSFLVNGKLYTGEMSYDDFKKILDDVLGAS